MSNTCACCGSDVPQAAYGCFACGAPRGETPGAPGVCPRCQYRLMQGARWCPGCNLAADKIAFGAPIAPEQATTAPQPADAPPSPPSQARLAAVSDQPPQSAREPRPPKPPKVPRPPRPPQPEGPVNHTRQNLIIGGVLGSAVVLAIAVTFLQPGTVQAPSISQPGAATGAEATLLADPIDGPFLQEFRDLLPGDYAAVMGYLLVQVPDPARDMRRFDQLLGERLGVLRFANAQDVAGAQDSVLDELADNMLRAMRAPEYCQAAINPSSGGLDPANVETRRLAAAINTSIVRAIASGRKHQVARAPPTPAQSAAFQAGLRNLLYEHQWQAYRANAMGRLPPDEQCAIYVAHWTLIAGYPPALSASWTSDQMKQPAQ